MSVWEKRQIISCKLFSLVLCWVTGCFWLGFSGLCWFFSVGFFFFVFVLINTLTRVLLWKICLCYNFGVSLCLPLQQSWDYLLSLKLVHRDMQLMAPFMQSIWLVLLTFTHAFASVGSVKLKLKNSVKENAVKHSLKSV